MTASVRPPPDRWGELDGYRGLLAVAIVVFHADQESLVGASRHVYGGSWVGATLANLDSAVAAFLALSGFLIFLPFAKAALAGEDAPPLKRFLTRRLVRIIPPYWAAVLLVWLSRYTGAADQRMSLLEHLTFTQVFDSKFIFWDIGPAWFLADNLMYCIGAAVFGLACCRACSRLRRRWTRLMALSCAVLSVIAVSVADKWWAARIAHLPTTDYPAYFGPLAKLDLFAFGLFLAVVVAAFPGRRPLGRALRVPVLSFGAAVIAWAFVSRNTGPIPQLYFHTVCGVGFTLVLAGFVLSDPGGLIKRLLSVRPLALLGLVSYGLFLWHEPVLVLVATDNKLLTFTNPATFALNTAVLVALSLVVATFAYRTIEVPVKRIQAGLATASAFVRPPVTSPDELRGLSWFAFVNVLSEACVRHGWRVEGEGLRPGGLLNLRRGSERRTLMCELWWRTSVGVSDVRAVVAHTDQPSETGFVTAADLDYASERTARTAGLHVLAGPALVSFLGDEGVSMPWLEFADAPADN